MILIEVVSEEFRVLSIYRIGKFKYLPERKSLKNPASLIQRCLKIRDIRQTMQGQEWRRPSRGRNYSRNLLRSSLRVRL